jgi:hypothetical protein
MNTTYSWPDSVDRAFRLFYYGGQYEKHVEAFIQRWGKPSVPALRYVLTAGTPEEKVLALLALGYTGTPQAIALVLPSLESPVPLERWASALCLGELKDERALPALIHMLDEFLPPEHHPLEHEGGLYHSWRMKAVALLGDWERNNLAPVLRQALTKGWEFEQAEQGKRKQVWHAYQDELVYALGREGAFGAFSRLTVSPSRLHFWVVILCCGSLQARTRYGDVLTQLQINQELKDEVASTLQHRFGLSMNEQEEYIESYTDECFARME